MKPVHPDHQLRRLERRDEARKSYSQRCTEAIRAWRAERGLAPPPPSAPPIDPSKVLWTVMYTDQAGDLRPYAPAYTAIPYAQGRAALAELKLKFDRERFILTEAKDDHLTLVQGRAVLKALFRDVKPEIVPIVGTARLKDVGLLAHIGLDAAERQRKLKAWERTNEWRKSKGLRPVPKPDLGPEPEIVNNHGYVSVRLGGAR